MNTEEDNQEEEEEEEETLGLGKGATDDNIIYKVCRRLRPRRGVTHTNKYLSRLKDKGEIVRAIKKAPRS